MTTWTTAQRPAGLGRLGGVRVSPSALAAVAPAAGIAAYCLLSLLLYSPLDPLSTTHLPKGGFSDPAQMAWYLAWTPWAILHGHNPFFTNFVGYPHTINLATNTSVPALGLLAAPITLTLGPVAALNFLLRAAFALSATSMFLVLRQVRCRWWAAFAGGLLYGFSPYMTAQGQYNAHLDLLFVPIPPLLLWCLYELLVLQQRRRLAVGSLLGVLAAAQYLISAEILSGCAVMTALGAAILLVTRRRTAIIHLRRALPGLAVGLGWFVVLAGYPIWALLWGPGHIRGPVYPTRVLAPIRTDLLGAIVPTSHEALGTTHLAHVADRYGDANLSENGAYLGLPLIVVLAGLAVAWRRVGVVALSALLAVAAFVLSMGERLTVGGAGTGVVLPGVVFKLLPVLDSTVPARFSVFTFLFAAVVLAVGLDRCYDAWLGRRLDAVLGATASPAGGRRGGLRPRWSPAPAAAGTRGARHARVAPASDPRLRPALGTFLLATLVLGPLVPNVPWIDRRVPWSPALESDLRRYVPAGSVVLSYPYPVPPADPAMLWQADAGMRFRLVGAYASVPAGHAGNPYPPLESPAAVQEVLGAAELGRLSPYPPPPILAAAEGQLRIFLRLHRVTTVVFWPTGVHPGLARRLFSDTLGPPLRPPGGLLIWRLDGPPPVLREAGRRSPPVMVVAFRRPYSGYPT